MRVAAGCSGVRPHFPVRPSGASTGGSDTGLALLSANTVIFDQEQLVVLGDGGGPAPPVPLFSIRDRGIFISFPVYMFYGNSAVIIHGKK